MIKNKGWVVVAAATGINLILGVLYIWSIMNKALIQDYNWSSTQASMPYTVNIATFAFVMIFAGRVQDTKGPRISALLGGVLLGSGLILSGFVKNPVLMMITYGLMGGAGIGFCYAATTPPSVKWFPLEKKGLISGIVVSGVGFAAVYISPITSMLLDKYGLSTSFIVLGIGALIIITIFSMQLMNPPDDYTAIKSKQVDKMNGKNNHSIQYSWNQMLKTSLFYKLWLMYAFTASAGLMLIGHITVIAVNQAQWEKGFYFVVLLALFNTGGRIIAGSVSDKWGYTKTMQLIFVLQAVNMLMFGIYLNPFTLAFGVALTGLSYGALFSVFPAVIAENYGTKNLGVNYGFLFTSWGFAGMIGPLLAGKILDVTGNYNNSYMVSSALLIIATILTLTIKKSREKLSMDCI